MKRIRQGNTINFRYSVYRAVGERKEPEDLTGIEVTTNFQNRLYGSRVDVPFSVEGNVLIAQIPGLPILKTGVYNFSLFYRKDGLDFAIDVDAFRIVDSSAKVGGADACPDVEAETVELDGILDFGIGGGIEQVQADWEETDPESKAFILRKPILSKVATSGSYEDLSGRPTIPVLPEGIVIDANYVHTDNNYTSEEKEKLAGLENYNDTPLRTALQDEINRATEAESNLDAAVKKVASDFATFLSSDPDADNLINRWQEVTAFLNGITEDKTLSGMLLEMKTEINESVVTKLASYYTAARVDELFVKKLVGSRLMTEEEATKLSTIEDRAQANVKADWNAKEGDAVILNKPVLSKVATSGSYEDLSGRPTIPVVSNDFTNEEKSKLAGLENYNDTPLRTALQDEINRATEAESNLDAAVKKVASDFATFLSSDPDADNLINRWQEVTAFLNGITEDKTLSGMLLEMKSEIGESVATKLASYYTAARVDELFVKKLVGSRLMTEEEATKLSTIEDRAQANVKADWNAKEGDAVILNKPVLSKVATSGSYEDLSGRPTIPVVSNDFTNEEKSKLAGLENYNDTPLRTALQDEINRATEAESNLDAAVKKVASDFATFLSSDPDADNLINRWQEVTAFLNGITEDTTLSGMLLEMKSEIGESVATKLASYYTAARVDELFVKKLVGSRLMTEEEATKLADLQNYDDTALQNSVDSLEQNKVSGISVTGEGNVITGVSKDADGTTLLFTKEITALDQTTASGRFVKIDGVAEANINEKNTFGFVSCYADSFAASDRNYPIRQAGLLIYGTAANGSANQIYGSWKDNRWFARGGGASTNNKTPWKEFVFHEDLKRRIIDSPVQITEKADLNDFVAPGFYFCPTSFAVSTLANSPTIHAFGITVTQHAGIQQRLVEFLTNSPAIYFRNYYNFEDRWGPWYREYTSANPPPLASEAENGFMSSVDKGKVDRLHSYTTATTLSGLSPDIENVYATISTAQTIGVTTAGVAYNGRTITIYVLPSAAVTITIPTTGSYVSMCGASYTTVANKWVEFSLVCINGLWHIAKLEQE